MHLPFKAIAQFGHFVVTPSFCLVAPDATTDLYAKANEVNAAEWLEKEERTKDKKD